ncbi:glycoside hydrolase family 32 protein [Pontibacillus yanchengensis]|uniref:Glycoside hydrolase family 32 protein n=3 Tax=Pontibacillus yanchengensis TaxID=462910 RepID=A0A6I4ZPE0_9BACI|nr:glycoside hydrolase family 32 protein [Pontibacillus yanchengensis]MYL52715.1 glycoside hydrolase family 32 protein [Pontibacillus yanchengensis]
MTTNHAQAYRPYLHFAPNENWMNDPNGLVYFEEEYHLFFQYHPYSSVWGPMHWGHAVSKDLIHWEELDIALHPDEHGMIFSGSAVVDRENTTGFFPDKPGLVAIFTHHLDGEEGENPVETQSLAYSHDYGRTWKKYDGNPVLTSTTKVDFRDPKVFWHKETSKWIMVLATGQTITIYSSSNLLEWQYESEFGEGIGCHDGVWECPDLFPLSVQNSDENKWVMLVSTGDTPEIGIGSKTQYFVGHFDGSTFVPEPASVNWLDFGKDNYAGVSFSDIPNEDGRRIYVGWMSNWLYANEVPTDGWRSQMTVPRTLSLQKKEGVYQLIQEPVQELDAYFTKKQDIDEQIDQTCSYDIHESYIDVNVTIDGGETKEYGLNIHHTPEQFTTILFNRNNNSVKVDRTNSGKTEFSKHFPVEQGLELEDSEQVQLSILIDSSSIELFLQEGEYALTSLVYPDQACERLSFFTKDRMIKVNGTIHTPV